MNNLKNTLYHFELFNSMLRKYEIEKLFSAIRKQENNLVISYITAGPSLIESVDYRGITPLMQAVAVRNYAVIQYLLQVGVDTSRRDSDGWTARTWATFINDKKAKTILANKSAILIDSSDNSGAIFGLMAL